MEEMNEKKCEEMDKMGTAEPERLTSLTEAESKGELVLNYANNLAKDFKVLLNKVSPEEELETPAQVREALRNRIEGLKFTFEDIESKLAELQEIKNKLMNIIG